MSEQIKDLFPTHKLPQVMKGKFMTAWKEHKVKQKVISTTRNASLLVLLATVFSILTLYYNRSQSGT